MIKKEISGIRRYDTGRGFISSEWACRRKWQAREPSGGTDGKARVPARLITRNYADRARPWTGGAKGGTDTQFALPSVFFFLFFSPCTDCAKKSVYIQAETQLSIWPWVTPFARTGFTLELELSLSNGESLGGYTYKIVRISTTRIITIASKCIKADVISEKLGCIVYIFHISDVWPSWQT